MIKPALSPEDKSRKGWNEQGKTQFVSMLHNMDLMGTQMPTMTIKHNNTNASPNNIPSSKPGETITISKTAISGTIVLEKSSSPNIPDITSSAIVNKTIVLSANQNEDKDNGNDIEVIDIGNTTESAAMKNKCDIPQKAWSEGMKFKFIDDVGLVSTE